jgi:hypothetical protein
MTITPDRIQFSALTEGLQKHSIIVRVYNPVGSPVDGTLHCERPIGKAFLATLNQDDIREIGVSGGHDVDISLPPYGIATVKMQMA